MTNQGMFPKVRRGRVVAALLAGVATLLLSGGTASAQQESQGKYVTEAAQRLGQAVAQANRDGYKFTDDNFSIGGGWLRQGENNWVALFRVRLDRGVAYRIVAAGELDARDVDVQILDPNDKVMVADTATDPNATVNFVPNATQQYLVRVRLYASDQNLPCLCLAVVMQRVAGGVNDR